MRIRCNSCLDLVKESTGSCGLWYFAFSTLVVSTLINQQKQTSDRCSLLTQGRKLPPALPPLLSSTWPCFFALFVCLIVVVSTSLNSTQVIQTHQSTSLQNTYLCCSVSTPLFIYNLKDQAFLQSSSSTKKVHFLVSSLSRDPPLLLCDLVRSICMRACNFLVWIVCSSSSSSLSGWFLCD